MHPKAVIRKQKLESLFVYHKIERQTDRLNYGTKETIMDLGFIQKC